MRISIRAALAGAVLLFACLAATADDELPQALPPDQEAAAIAAAETLGRAIFEHDRAAAVATDAAMAKRSFKRDRRVHGWVTEARDNGIAVTFIDQTPAALYRVVVSPRGKAGPLVALEAPEPLSPFEADAAAARAAALDVSYEACSETYNSVVLPPAEGTDDAWVVYLLPGTTRNDTVPIGGTFRVEVRDGAVVSQRAFTYTCIALPHDRKRSGVLMITHLLDAVPTEAHVHWSLWAGTPMIVATPPDGVMWGIERGVISKIEREGRD